MAVLPISDIRVKNGANKLLRQYAEWQSEYLADFVIAHVSPKTLILNYAPYMDDIVGTRLTQFGFSVTTYDPYKENPKHDRIALCRQYDLVISELILNRQINRAAIRSVVTDLTDCVRPGKPLIVTYTRLPNTPPENKLAYGQDILERNFQRFKYKKLNSPLCLLMAKSPYEYSSRVQKRRKSSIGI